MKLPAITKKMICSHNLLLIMRALLSFCSKRNRRISSKSSINLSEETSGQLPFTLLIMFFHSKSPVRIQKGFATSPVWKGQGQDLQYHLSLHYQAHISLKHLSSFMLPKYFVLCFRLILFSSPRGGKKGHPWLYCVSKSQCLKYFCGTALHE